MKNNLVFLGLIFGGIIFRLLPHAANVTPIGAITLFAFSYFSYKKALFVPLTIMLFTDIILGFHPTMLWVYGSLMLAGIILRLRASKSVSNVFAHSLAASFMFYLITNFGVWLTSGMYQKTFSGLIECYFLAIPFFRNSLVGDVVYGLLIFGSYNHAHVVANIYQKTLALFAGNKKIFLQSISK